MPDYNLGRAHGEIDITADTRGAQEAQAAMAATAAEAETLDKSMVKVNEQFDKNRQSSILTAEQLVRHRGQVEELRKTYERYNQDAERAATRAEQADRKLQEGVRRQETDAQELLRLGREKQRAQELEERLTLRAEQAYERYHNRISALNIEVEKFNDAHLRATSGLSNITNQAERAGRAIEQLTDKLSAIVKIVGTTGLYGLFGGAAGGALGLAGAGGLQGLTVGLGAVLEMIKDFSGALLLLPAVTGAAAVSIGSLAVAFHGVGEALSSMEDPVKFVQALRELSPAARSVVVQLQSFTFAFRGAREMVQESLFAPLIADIQPLVQTWLPQLMHAGQQIAGEFGQALHQVFQFFQQPQVIQGFQTFIGNMVTGFNAARQAIQPFLQAWITLSSVGSQVFGRLGTAIATVANEFNNWVQRSAESGQLLRLINQAIDGFTTLGHIIRDFGQGLLNIFEIAGSQGNFFLNTIAKIADEFKNWTESVKGQSAIANFFDLLKQSSEALRPILHLVGEGLSIIAGTLDRLGISIQSGLISFFTSFVQALRELSPSVREIAPALNEFLTAFGKALLEIVQGLGPQLPQFFKNFADALVELSRIIVPVAVALGQLFEHLTPTQIEVLLGVYGALKLIGAILPTITVAVKAFQVAMAALDVVLDANPIGLVIVAIAALVAGLIYAYNHFKTFHDAVDDAWQGLQKLWHAITNIDWSHAFQGLIDVADKVGEWGERLVKNFANGIKAGVHWVVEGIGDLVDVIERKLHLKSPAKEGPLSEDDGPEGWGAKFSSDYAAGIESGTGDVADASTGVAAAAAGGVRGGDADRTPGGAAPGFGGGFTSAGQPGISGQGLVGGTGFDQWIKFVTGDMQAWLNIAQHGWQIFQDITEKVVEPALKVVASIWGGGKNPLTQAGGIFGPPITQQQNVPGVPNVPVYGPAPIPALTPLGGPQANQQGVPGVPSINERGQVVPPGPPAPAPAPAPPPAGGPAAAAPSPAGGPSPGQGVPQYTGKDAELAAELKKNGFTDSEIIGLVALNGVETGNWSHPESIMGFTNEQTGPGIEAHVKGFKKMWDNRQAGGAVVGVGQPDSGIDASGKVTDPGKYANWLLKLEGYSATQDAAGNKYPEGQFMSPQTYAAKVSGAYANLPPAAAAAPGAPSGAVNVTTPNQLQNLLYGPQAPQAPGPIPSLLDRNRPQLGPSAPGGGPLGGGGPVSLNLGDKVTVQTNSIDCGPASARIVLQGDAQFGGQGAKQVEDLFTNIAGAGQGPQAYRDLLNRYAPQANYTFTPSAGSTPEALMRSIATSVNAGFAPILNYNAPGPIRGAVGGPIGNFEKGGQIEHFVVVQGYDPSTNTVQIRDPGVTDPATGQASVYSIPAAEALRLSQNQGLIAAQPAAGVRGATPFLQGGINLAAVGAPLAPAPAPPPAPAAPPAAGTVPGPGGAPAFPYGGQPPASRGGPKESDLNKHNLTLIPPPGAPEPPPGQAYQMFPRGTRALQTIPSDVPGGPPAPPPSPAAPAPAPPPVQPGAPPLPAVAPTPDPGAWMRLPPGADPKAPIPFDVRRAHGIPDTVPPIYYSSPQAPNLPPVPAVPGSAAPSLQPGAPNLLAPNPAYFPEQAGLIPPTTPEAAPGVGPGGQSTQSPFDQFTSGLQSVGKIIGDGFKLFGDTIKDIQSAAAIGDTLVRGVANTEDIVHLIQDIQPFIQTAADVAGTVGDVGGIISAVGSGSGGADFGGTAAAGAAIQAIAGIVQGALAAVNESISLGIEVYHEIGKYAGFIFGGILGGALGSLGGNVRMLLNTRTGQIQAYSESNPLNKNVINTPFTSAYTQPAPGGPVQNNLNIYAGPAQQTPVQMMQNSMWLVSTGAPAVASVAAGAT